MNPMEKVVIFVLMCIARVIVCGGIIATAAVAVFVVIFNIVTFIGGVVAKTMVDPTGLIMFVTITAVVALFATIVAWRWSPETA